FARRQVARLHRFGDRSDRQKVPAAGGVPVTLATAPVRVAGASWGPDNQIIYASGRALYRVSADGGAPAVLLPADAGRGESFFRFPSVIPGRNAVLVTTYSDTGLDWQLAVLDLATNAVTHLGIAGARPHYVASGHLVYAWTDGSLRAVRFDTATLRPTGNPEPILDGVSISRNTAPQYSVTSAGSLAYVRGTAGEPQ